MSQEEIADNWEALEDSGELDRRLPTVSQPKDNSRMSAPVLQEDGCRSTFQPQIRILKRDPITAKLDTQPKPIQQKPVKTLQQREAEYAQARLRILGSAAAPAAPDTNNTDTTPVNSEEQKSAQLAQLALQVEQVRMTDNIIRLPLGPSMDGKQGFTTPRDGKR